jgi:ParB family transcriptional regulator, chromosome partitioning protein
MKNQEIVEIPVASVQPDPGNLRTVFDQDELQALAENIKEHGQLDPVQVFERVAGTYDLWDGERRWRAVQLVQLPTLRAIVVARPSEVDLLCKKISRFMQTKTLSKPEEVRALEQGLKSLGVFDKPDKWPTAAKKLGVPTGLLRERMRITKLVPELRAQFESGELNYSVSHTIGKIEQAPLQKKIADFVIKEGVHDRFAVLQFIPKVLENPKRSLIESYDLAKSEEQYRYSTPRKKEEVPAEIEKRIDDMLDDFRKCLRWLEAAGRQDLISHLTPENFNTRRVLTTLRHVSSMSGAFISAYDQRYGGAESPRVTRPQRQLMGSSKLLDDLKEKE